MADKQKSCAFRTTIGGQALIEGILMRGPEKQAIVVRSKDGLVTKVEPLKLIRDRYPVLGLPVIRGVATFLSSMVNGVKALMFSADYFPEEELGQPSKLDQWLEKHVPAEKLQGVLTWVAVLLSLGLTVGLFMLLPTFLAGLVDPYIHSAAVHNLIEGVVKVAIFMGYMILVSRQKDIARVFQYHGAEHKTIFCYEAGLDLTVENARIQPKHHPRCGTSFLFVVIIVSILFSSLVLAHVEWRSFWVRVLVHMALLIPVVGVTYEFNRWVGRHDNALTRVLSAPGMWMQNFTTNEPDDSMLEVAIEAMKLVLPEEQGKDTW
ncbi:MAG: DUF1385 domain-containing protein [Ruminococcaceae bacterium]|jgi:uncharacterized protein YqhQ|nr:DUF1385 domain-containing protein [Oscillospiraceae bacterium]